MLKRAQHVQRQVIAEMIRGEQYSNWVEAIQFARQFHLAARGYVHVQFDLKRCETLIRGHCVRQYAMIEQSHDERNSSFVDVIDMARKFRARMANSNRAEEWNSSCDDTW